MFNKKPIDYQEAANQFAEILPEVNYFVFSLYEYYIPDLFRLLGRLGDQLTIYQSDIQVSGPLWNYLDALCSFITACSQFYQLYHDYHAQKQDLKWYQKLDWILLFKAITNFSNSVVLSTLTALNFALFGGPAFAAAFCLGFLHSVIDLIKWTVLYFISLRNLENSNNIDLNNFYYQKKLSEFKNLYREISILWKQDTDRKKLTQLTKEYQELFKDLLNIKNNNNKKAIIAKFRKQEKKNFLILLRDMIVWGLAAAGMVLLCFSAPHLILAGYIVVAAASLGYILKNINRSHNLLQQLFTYNKPAAWFIVSVITIAAILILAFALNILTIPTLPAQFIIGCLALIVTAAIFAQKLSLKDKLTQFIDNYKPIYWTILILTAVALTVLAILLAVNIIALPTVMPFLMITAMLCATMVITGLVIASIHRLNLNNSNQHSKQIDDRDITEITPNQFKQDLDIIKSNQNNDLRSSSSDTHNTFGSEEEDPSTNNYKKDSDSSVPSNSIII